MLMLAMAAFTLTSCSDVPMPYDNPNGNGNGGNSDTPIEIVGEGTSESPYNVESALQLITSGEAPDEEVYVNGIISQDPEIDTSYGNATYYISDDGTTTAKQLEVYRGYSLGGKKFTSKDAIKMGDKVIVRGKLVYYNNRTPEFTQGSQIYSLNGTTEGNDTPAQTIGTIDAPKTVSEVVAIIDKMEDNGLSTEFYYVKGTIKTIKTDASKISQYKNIDYVITDGQKEMTVFRGKNLDNTDFTAAGQIDVGDEVVVLGQLQKYVKDGNVTPELAQGNYLVKLTKGQGTPQTPEGKTIGSLENPKDVTDVVKLIEALADNGTSTDQVYVKGKVKEVITTPDNIVKYKNCDFVITDGTSDVKVFRGKYLNNTDFTAGDQIAVGDEVVVLGKYMKYVKNGETTPEITEGYIAKFISHGSGQDPQTPDTPSGPYGTLTENGVTLQTIDLNMANQEEATTIQLVDNITLTFDKGSNKNAPKYYNTGTSIRMYPGNSLTITAAKNIMEVDIECGSSNQGIGNASGDVTAEPGGVQWGESTIYAFTQGKQVVITNTSQKTGIQSQIYIKGITIKYAQ